MAQITGSVTGQNKRYNDDFVLYFDGSDQYLYVDDVFPVIDNANDWSISFYLSREFKGQATSLFDNRPLTTNQGGISLFITEEVTSTFRINFRSGFGVPPVSAYKFQGDMQYNELYYIVLSHDSTTDNIKFYINSVLKDTLDVSTRIINSNNNSYSIIGAQAVPVGTNLFSHLGTISRFRIFDKQIDGAYNNDLYVDGLQPTKIDQNTLFNLPCNNIGYDSNTIIRNTLVTENGSTSKILFNFTPVDGDSLTAEILEAQNAGSLGFKTQNTPLFDNDHYILFVSNNQYFYQFNGTFVPSGVFASVGDVMEASINGTNVDLKVNNVVLNSYPIVGPVGNLIPFIYARIPRIASFQEAKWNGTNITRQDILSNFNTSLGDVVQIDTIQNYNYSKAGANLTASNAVMMNYTADEIGLNPSSNFLAYTDFYSINPGFGFSGGVDSIFFKSNELRYYGLKFDSISGHYLDIQGLNNSKTKGYTFLIAVANKNNSNWVVGQDNFFSHIGTEGNSRKFEINASSGVSKTLRTVFPSGGSTSGLSAFTDNDFDNSKIQFVSFTLSPNQNYVLPYERLGQTRAYGEASFNTNVNQNNSINLSNPLSFGFDEITSPITRIGYNGSDSLNGVLCYFAIIEGLADNDTITQQFNNGFLANPNDFERQGLKLSFFADLNNPFDDAGTIKIPDLGNNTLTVTVNSEFDASWDNLLGVQNSRVELKSLL